MLPANFLPAGERALHDTKKTTGGVRCAATHLCWLPEQSGLRRAARDFPDAASVVVRRNVSRDTPLPLGGELAELQIHLGIKFFHDDVSEIRREAWRSRIKRRGEHTQGIESTNLGSL